MTRKRGRKKLAELSSESSDDSDESDEASDTDSAPDQAFCKCGAPNTDDMIGCDGQGCPYEWLHFKCVGINPKNIPRGKWLCEECSQKQNKDEKKHHMPRGQFVLPVSDPSRQNDSKKGADNHVPSDSLSIPVSNASIDKNFLTATEKNTCDNTMKRSLNQAEKQLASSLRQACNAVIHKGTSVGDAAQQFGVGRYVLGDFVRDQLKLNLTRACREVIAKKRTIEEAALVYGVTRGILSDRIKAEKEMLRIADGPQLSSQPLSRTEFEANLQQACRDVLSKRLTTDKAGKTYKIHSETIRNKLQSCLVLTTAEENDLVTMSVRLAVLGHSEFIKSTVFSKVKALLDEEEKRGIRRIHSFKNNTPDDFWWETFCNRHPEFNAISSKDSNNPIRSDVTSGRFSGLPANQNSNEKGHTQEPKPNLLRGQQESTTDQVFYILPTQVPLNKQFILVRQNSLSDNKGASVADAQAIRSVQSVVPSQPVGSAKLSHCPEKNEQSLESSEKTDNLSHPSMKQGESGVIQPSLDCATVETEDQNLVVAANEVIQDDMEVASFAEGVFERPSLVVGANERPSLVIGVNEQPSLVVGADQQPSLVVGANEQPSLVVRVNEQPSLVVGADQQPRLVVGANEQPSLVVGINEQPSLVVGADQQRSLVVGANEQPNLVVGVNEQPSLVIGANEQPSLVVGANEQPSLVIRANEQPSLVIGANEQPSLVIGANEQPSLVIGANEQPSLVVGANEQPRLVVGANEQPSLVVGANEVILPSLSATGDEIIQTDVPVANESAQPELVVGTNKVAEMNSAVDVNKLVQPDQVLVSDPARAEVILGTGETSPLSQVVANEGVDSSSMAANGTSLPTLIAPTKEVLQPGLMATDEHPSLTVGANEVIQLSQDSEPGKTVITGGAAQPSLMATDGASQSHLAIAINKVVQSSMCVTPNSVVQPHVVGPVDCNQSTFIVPAGQALQPGQVIYAQNIVQPNVLISNKQVLQQNYVVTSNRVVEPNTVGSINPGLLAGGNRVVLPSPEAVTIKYRFPTSAQPGQPVNMTHISSRGTQAYPASTGESKVAPSTPPVVPESTSSTVGKPSENFQNSSNNNPVDSKESTSVFVTKHKIDKTLPDALTCLEKTLTKEQKESFAFRLQIGDNCRDDALYNAWRALKRLYSHTDIYAMYGKQSPEVREAPSTFDLPVATKLMELPLMDPFSQDKEPGKEKHRRAPTSTERGAQILKELRQGRKRRRISSVLERRKAEKTKQGTKRFLEPWKYEIKKPSRRKSCITRYVGEDSLSALSDDEVPLWGSDSNLGYEIETEGWSSGQLLQ